MFDLFRSRAKTTRYLLGALLILVALSMVVTLIPGYGTPGTSDSVVAKIGNQTLTASEVQHRIQMAMRDRSIPADLAPMLLPPFINEMIADRAIEYEAQRHGLAVTDAEVATTIRSLLPQLYQNGKFLGNQVYAAYLAQQNMTIEQFEAAVRRDMIKVKFQNLALEGMIVTPQEIEREFIGKNQKVKLDYIVLSADKYRNQVKVTPEEIDTYFQAHRGEFRIPEKRDAAIIVANEKAMETSITLTDDQLRRIYNQEKENFRVPDRVHVRHILLKTMDKPKDEIPKIQAKAEDLLKQIKHGADFAELARKYSEDPGSASKGGDLGWVTRGQTVKNFEQAAFSLKPKEISNVIQTEYGFHIIQVLEKDTARVKPFEEVKDTIASEQKKQMVLDRMQSLADQARAQLVANPGQAQQIAAKLGLEYAAATQWAPGSPLPLIGSSREAQDAISTLGKGDVSPVIQPSETELAVVEVTAISPPRDAELNEVEAKVRDVLASQKVNQLLMEKVEAAAAALKTGGLTGAAKTAGVEIKSTDEFTRAGAAEGLGSPEAFPQAFSQPVGSTFGPVNLGGRFMFAKVALRTEPDPSKLAAQRDELVTDVKTRKARMRKDLLDDGVLEMLSKQGKLKIHQDAIDRIIAAYRS